MAISPSATYPGQVEAAAGYPLGRARNETVVDVSRDGTPFEAVWINDLWGFLQALLTAAGITPSGSPDQVGASQYLEAIRYLTEHVQGNAFFEDNVEFGDPVTFHDLVQFNGIFYALYDGEFGGNFAIGGACTVAGATTLGGACTVTGVTTLVGGCATTELQCTGTATVGTLRASFIDDPVQLTGDGRIRERAPQFGANFDNSYSVAVTNLVIAAAITANRAYTIDDAFAANGDKMTFVNDTAFDLTINAPGPSALITLSGAGSWCDVQRINNAWRVIRHG